MMTTGAGLRVTGLRPKQQKQQETMGNASRLHYGNKYAHSRKGQGVGVPRFWSEERKHPGRFCPICGIRFGGDVHAVAVRLDRKTATVPRWIPARLDGKVVPICSDFCKSIILTGHFERDDAPEEIVRSNGVYVGGEQPAIGKKRCRDCGEPIHHSATRCNLCAHSRKGQARARKHFKEKAQ